METFRFEGRDGVEVAGYRWDPARPPALARLTFDGRPVVAATARATFDDHRPVQEARQAKVPW